MTNLLLSLGVAAATVYLGAAATLFLTQRRLIYPGQGIDTRGRPLPATAGLEPYGIATPTGRIEAWYLPPLGSTVPFPALIFAHGNGEVIDMWPDAFDEFRRWGLAVMLVEYPGYGRSEGSPSETAIDAAMVGAYDVLVARPGVDPGRIVGYGQSLGGGAIAALSERRSLRAMILQSTFTSLLAFPSRFLMPGFLLRDRFDNLAAVRSFTGPLLVLHGEGDELIPYAQGVALANAGAHAELHLYECGHGCWQRDGIPLFRDIHRFLQASAVLPSETHARAN
jgi:pimeloyl-ACP methyl ester carboxylesterase